MKKSPLQLKPAVGGLNTRDHPAEISPAQYGLLENYYTDAGFLLKKRPGMDMAQFAPIAPSPMDADATTFALWHLDEGSAGPWLDSSGNGYNFTKVTKNASGPQSATGLLPISGPLGVKPGDILPTGNRGYLTASPGTALDGLAAVTFEAWVNIPPSFSGKPKLNGGTDSGVAILTTAFIPPSNLNVPLSGLSIFRDWDSTLMADTSDPYIVFRLSLTNGIFTVKTGWLPTSVWLHVRGEYDSATGIQSLFVNGVLVAKSVIPGAQVLREFVASGFGHSIILGGGSLVSPANNPGFNPSFCGVVDDARISTAVGLAFPFKKPRGKQVEYAKSDGTRQLVTAAEDGLYFTLGDGKWTLMGAGFDSEADWDMGQDADIFYMSNGTDTPKAWDGITLIDWGNPTTPPTLNESANGTLLAGTRKYAYSYLYGDYETGLSPIATITNNAGKEIEVYDMPTRHFDCTAIRVYRTKDGDDEFFFLRQIANDITVSSVGMTGPFSSAASPFADAGDDGVADGSLGGGSDYTLLSGTVAGTQLHKPKYMVFDSRRCFAFGFEDEPYHVRWSEPGAINVFRAYSFTKASSDKGPLVGGHKHAGEKHFSKDGNAMLVLRGDSPANWTQFEWLHPTVGAVDHWSFVERLTPLSDHPTLCFLARDGIYGYDGYEYKKLSDEISPTIASLAQANSTKTDWLVTTTSDFYETQAGQNPGTATPNIFENQYEQDGLREVAGSVRIVNQKDYIGLWSPATAPAGITGKVYAITKGAAKSEYYFATAQANGAGKIWHTTDNFLTVSMIAGSDTFESIADPRVIEMVYQNIAGIDTLFLFTADGGATPLEAGYVWRLDDPVNNPTYTKLSNDLFYWMADVPWNLSSGLNGTTQNLGSYNGGANDQHRFDWLGNTTGPRGGGTNEFFSMSGPKWNIFLNHTQDVQIFTNQTTPQTFNGGSGTSYGLRFPTILVETQSTASSTDKTYGTTFGSGNNQEWDIKALPNGINGDYVQLTKGFYGFQDAVEWVYKVVNDASGNPHNDSHFVFTPSDGFNVNLTRRETAFYNGGTFRPQAFYCGAGAVPYLYFLGSNTDDAHGNRLTSVFAIDLSTNTLTAVDGDCCTALAFDPATNLGYASIAFRQSNVGFSAAIATFDATSAITTATENIDKDNYLPLRLGWNQQALVMGVSGKKFNFKSAPPDYERQDYEYSGFVGNVSLTGSPYALTEAPGYSFAVNEDSGVIPVELAVQTDAPFSFHVAIDRLTDAALLSMNDIATASSVEKASGYISPNGATVATGIRSNLLFVESSGAPDYLWSDRLYWQTDAALGDERFVQLGVEGNWIVKGEFISDEHDLSTFNSFGIFGTDYSLNGVANAVDFFFRNAATRLGLAATDAPVTPNKKIMGFAPVGEFAQWRIDFTWENTLAVPTSSPYVNFVDIGYFLGNPNVPRVVAEHWQDRTYWGVASANSDVNDIVLVLQRDNTWTMFKGWNLGSIGKFRNELIGLHQYQTVKLLSGRTDLGELISGRARKGYIMGQNSEKTIRSMQAVITSNMPPVRQGWLKVIPYSAVTPSASSWVIPILSTSVQEPRMVAGSPRGSAFEYAWATAWTLEIRTSDDTTGPYVPAINQEELIGAFDAKIFESSPRPFVVVR